MSGFKNDNLDFDELDFHDVSLETLGAHLFFGEVDTDSVKSAISFVLKSNMLHRDNREISIYLNTVGGSCYDGFGLIDIMNISRLPVKTVGIGNIMSMGVLLLCAGAPGRRIITKNTQVMAHQFSGGAEGKFHELVSAYKAELYLEQLFLQHFLRNSTMNEKKIRDIMFGPTDRWLSPTECRKLGLVDHVIDELPDFNLAHQISAEPRSKRPVRK